MTSEEREKSGSSMGGEATTAGGDHGIHKNF